MITVRFAPSPTGYLHVGGARTALFNWLYARAQGGRFILRIEDTDTARSKKEYLDEILDSMRWLGLAWDALYHQSGRFDIYRGYAQKLLDEKKARREGEAVILPMPQSEVVVHDIVRGEIHFDAATIKDQVLMKSDGSPTYSFACVVDDALMEISHVIRGDDHISNTPKQIVMYEALGFKTPKFAHLPLIMGEEGGRLSKRTGAVAVSEYRDAGFMPEGLVNYLMLLGWSPGAKEIVTLQEAVKKFSLKKVNKTPAEFSLDKLTWINAQHIKALPAAVIAERAIPFLKQAGYINEDFDRKRLETIVELYQARMPTLCDFVERAAYIFKDSIEIDPALKECYLAPGLEDAFMRLKEKLAAVNVFDARSAEEAFRSLVEEMGMAAADSNENFKINANQRGYFIELIEDNISIAP